MTCTVPFCLQPPDVEDKVRAIHQEKKCVENVVWCAVLCDVQWCAMLCDVQWCVMLACCLTAYRIQRSHPS